MNDEHEPTMNEPTNPEVGTPPPDPTATPVTAQPAIVTPPTTPIAPIARTTGAGADPTSPAAPMWSAHESASAPLTAPLAPVVAVSPPRRTMGKLRWAIALVVVALVAGTASAAFIAMSGSAASSTVARWAPAGSLLYVETRLDLPGDQHAALGKFLAAFPGFADQSTLDSKLDEAYDKLVRSASSGGQDYTTNIKPWFGGQVAFVLPTFPDPTKDTTASARAAVIASVTDATKASAWLASLPAPSGDVKADYNGVSLSVGGAGDRQYAYGVDGPIVVFGDLQTVHQVIDTKGSTGLAATDTFKQAVKAYNGDHLTFAYGDVKGLIDGLKKASPAAMGSLDATLLAQVPAWFATAVKADGNNLIIDLAEPTTAGSPALKDRTSVLATHLPATTIAEFESHDVGTSIKNALKLYADNPQYKASMATITDALDRVGGIDSFTSWVGDTAIAVTKDGAAYGGGIVIALPSDASADTARGKLATLKNLASLGGAGKVTVTDATYNGATITTLDMGPLSSLSPGTTLPSGFGDGRAAVSFTLSNGLVVFGVGGDGFVKAVLDTKSGSALSDQARYKTAMDAAGAANVSQGYVDLKTIVDAIVAAMPADQQPTFVSNVLPYLSPIQSVSLAGHAGDVQHAVTVLTVGK